MRHLLLATGLALAIAAASPSPASSAGRGGITSAFSSTLNCTPLEEGSAEESEVRRCTGVSGVPLFIQYGDNRYDISAGVNDDGEDFCAIPGCGFNYPGDTVEWRLAGNRPYAIIYRIIAGPAAEGEPVKMPSLLMVETVGKKPCRIAEIPGNNSNANALARKAADLVLSGKVRCIDFQARRRQEAEARRG